MEKDFWLLLAQPYFVRPGEAPEYAHLDQAGTGVTPKDTDDYLTNDKPINIGHQIFALNPDKNRFLSYVMEVAEDAPTSQHKFSHLEEARNPQWVEYTGADGDTSTSIIIAKAARLVGRMRLYNPRTKEIILVDSTPTTTTVTVTRNFGSPGTQSLNYGDKLKIMAPAREQGSSMLDFRSYGRVEITGRTSIISWSVTLTGTSSAERLIDGQDPFEKELMTQWANAASQRETELIFGAKNLDQVLTGGSHPIHTSEGIDNFVTTHQFVFNGRITRFDLWDIMDEVAKDNAQQNTPVRMALVCSWKLVGLVSGWSLDKVRISPGLQTDGLQIFEIITPRGRFDLIPVDVLSEDPILEGRAWIVNRNQIRSRPLIGAEDRDVRYLPVNRDEVDVKEGQIFGEVGWELFHEETFGAIEGLIF
ncbi:MAG: hypothetical protein ACE5GA_00160 [Candidatus Zixiibacteriota bacterium]